MRTRLAVSTEVFVDAAKRANKKSFDIKASDNTPFAKFLALHTEQATTDFVDAIEKSRQDLNELGANFVGSLASRLVRKELYSDFIRLVRAIREDSVLFRQIDLAEHLYPTADGILKERNEKLAGDLLKALEGKHAHKSVQGLFIKHGIGWQAFQPSGTEDTPPLPS